jgi:hypothetical protein
VPTPPRTRADAEEERKQIAYRQLKSEKSTVESLFRQRETIFEADPSDMLVVDREGRIAPHWESPDPLRGRA